MTDKRTCPINLHMLQAVALAASTDDHRHYLQGVLVEITPQGVTYVATNGSMLLVAHDALAQSNFTATLIVPLETCLRAKLPKGRQVDSVVLEQVSAESYVLDDTRFSPIDGTFPDWRRVVPVDMPELNAPRVPSQFDPKYVALFAKAAVKLNGGSPDIIHGPEPRAPAIVTFQDQTVFGVLMPRRGGSAWTLPAWVRPATPSSALAAE